MTDIVKYYQENRSEFGDYKYLQQFEPDAEGNRFNEELDFDRMREVHDLETVPDGVSGDRQMKQYMSTDLLEGNLTREHFERGFTKEEYNDLINYFAWHLYDFLALRVSEGKSSLIPRQEYETLGTIFQALRYGEFYKVLLDRLGIDGLIQLGKRKRRELGSQVRTGLAWDLMVMTGFGDIALDLVDVADPYDPIRLETKRFGWTVPLALLYGLRGEDGYISSVQNRYVDQFKHDDVIDYVTNYLEPLEGKTKTTFRQFMATAELFSYLMHYDNRTGVQDSGPYFVEDGKPMILREIWLDEPFTPWNDIAERQDCPYCVSVAFVLDPEELDLKEIRVDQTTFTEPSNYLDGIESGAAFIREAPEQPDVVPLDDIRVADIEQDLPDLESRLNNGIEEWYTRTSKLSRREKIMNGANVYYVGIIDPFLRATGSYEYFCDAFDLWEMPPMASDLYYTYQGDEAQDFFAQQIMFGYGWSEFTGEANEMSGYADYLADVRKKNWNSDLTGMKEIPDFWAEKMDENNILDVPLNKMEGKVDPHNLGDHLRSL